jgi:hypothetical protein
VYTVPSARTPALAIVRCTRPLPTRSRMRTRPLAGTVFMSPLQAAARSLRRSTTPGACNCASVPADRGANRMHACESCWEGVHVQAATCPVNTNDSCLATMCVSIALRPLPARLPIIMADVRPSDPCDPGLRSLSYIHSYSISPPFRSAIGVVRPVKDNKIEIDV